MRRAGLAKDLQELRPRPRGGGVEGHCTEAAVRSPLEVHAFTEMERIPEGYAKMVVFLWALTYPVIQWLTCWYRNLEG